MSKAVLQGNASGTGVVTLQSPNTNTDRTITLPDNSGNLLSDKSYAICNAYTSSNSSAFNYNTSTKVSFNATAIDSATGFNTSSNLYTVQSGYAGTYVVTAQVRFRQSSGGQTNQVTLSIQKNGSTVSTSELDTVSGSYFWGFTTTVTYSATLAVGDTIAVYGAVSTGNGANAYYFPANDCTLFIRQVG